MCQVCRRSFMRGAAALGAAGMFSSPLLAQARRGNTGASKLPPRGEFTIANAHVMTMDSALGDIAGGSVHVRNGEIVAIGKDVTGGGQRIDGTGMIVMPGLVETHWHMWNTMFRSFAGDKPEDGYFPTVARFGQQMSPEDIFCSTRLSAAEAINSGMTFVHSWCHNARSPPMPRPISARSPRSASAPAIPAAGRRACPTPNRPIRRRSRALPRTGTAGPTRVSLRSAWHGAASSVPARSSQRSISRNSTMPASSGCRLRCMLRAPARR